MKLLFLGFTYGGAIPLLDKTLAFNWLLLGVGLWSSAHGFDFVHSRVEVPDVFRGVQTGRAVVMAGHDFGAKASERQGAPVVAGADASYLLEIWKMGETRQVAAVSRGTRRRMRVRDSSAGEVMLTQDMQRAVQTGQSCCCSAFLFFRTEPPHVWARGWKRWASQRWLNC